MPHAGVCFVCFAHYLQTAKAQGAVYAFFLCQFVPKNRRFVPGLLII